MLNQKLQLKLSQKLSPQQIQLMKLIQLTTAELEQKIKNAEIDCKVPASKFKKYVAGRMLWNYDNLEPAEKKGILG